MSDRDDLLFCQTAVHNNLVSEERARECLDAVIKARQMGVPADIEQVFLNKEYMNSKQVRAILRALGRGTDADQPTILGDFKITGKLGEGSMGVVYRAKQVSLDRDVALKMLPPRLAGDESYVSRFHREARSAAKLNHQNIIQVYAAGTEKGYHYMVMELVDGATAMSILSNKGRFTERAAVKMMLEIGHALHHAHQDGLIHRDVKPDNIMIAQNGTSKLADLGLAKERLSTGITQAGAIIGTPHYMSPEQADSKAQMDGRSDIYSLGASVFHLVTGEPPFMADNVVNIIVMRQQEPAPPLKTSAPKYSDGFCAIIDKCLERNLDQRYQDATQLGTDLTLLVNGQPLKFAQNANATVVMQPPPSGTAKVEVDSKALELQRGPSAPAPASPAAAGPAPGPRAGRPAMANPEGRMDSGFQRESALGMILRPRNVKMFGGILAAVLLVILGVMFVPPLLQSRKDPSAGGGLKVSYQEALAKMKDGPDEYISNLAFLKKIDIQHLEAKDQGRLKDLISRIEKEVKNRGQTAYNSIHSKVGAALTEERIGDAIDAVESYPENLLVPDWEFKVEELKATVKTAASEYCKRALKELPGRIERERPATVLELIESMNLNKLESYAPGEVEALNALAGPVKVKYANLLKASTEARKVLEGIRQKMAANDWTGAIQFSADALENPRLSKALAKVEGADQFIRELEAMRDLRDGAFGYVTENKGKQVKFRGIPTTVHDFDGVNISVEKQGTQKTEGKVNDLLGVKDLVRLATDAGGAPELLQRQSDILSLFALDSPAQARQMKRLPELSGPFEDELEMQIQMKRIRDEMVYVPATTFPMGLPRTEIERVVIATAGPMKDKILPHALVRETPQREVTLNAFYVGKTEITRKQYAEFLAAADETGKEKFAHADEPEGHQYLPANWVGIEDGKKDPSHPVSAVSWYCAYAYAAWSGIRLLTEAEWECAASWNESKQKRTFPWGKARMYQRMDKLLRDMAKPNYRPPDLHPVDTPKGGASAWGCLNLAGNISEWVSDWYGPYPNEPQTNPTGPDAGPEKVYRGSEYVPAITEARTTSRGSARPETRVLRAGIRCAASPIFMTEVRLERYKLSL